MARFPHPVAPFYGRMACLVPVVYAMDAATDVCACRAGIGHFAEQTDFLYIALRPPSCDKVFQGPLP